MGHAPQLFRIAAVLSPLALVTFAIAQSVPLFQPAVPYDAGGSTTGGVVVSDIDGDGRLDLVSANSFACTYPFCIEGNVGVLLGNGDGTFQEPLRYASGGAQTGGVAVGDVNRDGRPDIVAANNCNSQASCSNGTIGVLLAQDGWTFQPAVVYSSGGYAAGSVAIADLNRDGNMDLVVANRIGGVGVLAGNGDGSFQTAVMHAAGAEYAHSLAVGDVNADDRLDVVVGSTCVQSPPACTNLLKVLLGNGDGSFQPAVAYDSKDQYDVSVTLGDVNDDGRVDLVAANQSGPELAVLVGNGDGTFERAATYPLAGVGSYGRGITVADLDADGSLDAVVSIGFHSSDRTGALGIFLGNGDGTFQPGVIYESGGSQTLGPADSGDMNGDGRLDIVSPQYTSIGGGSLANGVLGVLLNATSCSVPTVTAISATPSSLWPPNGRMVPVQVSGTIAGADAGCAVAATFSVSDEYGIVQPAGPITVSALGAYSFTVSLQASRLGGDKDGRRYTVTVKTEGTGGTSSAAAIVIVPHSRGQ
jgi:FG-GAP-like repeat